MTTRPESFESAAHRWTANPDSTTTVCALYRELDVDYCKSDQIGSSLGFPQREQFPANLLDGLLTFPLRQAQSRKMVSGSAVPRRIAGLLGFRRNTGEETRGTRKVKSEREGHEGD